MVDLKNKNISLSKDIFTNDFTKEDKKFMKIAIRLAEKAKGNTSPNPMVGAVIVKNGKILAKGFHRQAGYPHAEIEAINSCKNKEDLQGSVMYVTLEPCSIYGKTSPCTDSITKHKIKKVIIGSIDPNPEVNGRGIEKLKNAEVEVCTGLFSDNIEKQNEVFFKHIKSKMPFISCKIASSIDGKIAIKTSDSKWITSVDSRELVQKIRKGYDCILTGIATVIADDPYLFPRKIIKNNETTMCPDIPGNKAFYRIILDSNLRIDPNTNVVKTAQIVKTIIFTSKEINSSISIDNSNDKIDYLIQNNIDIIQVSAEHHEENGKNSAKLNLNEIIHILYKKYGITSILIESGPTLVTSFLTNNLINKFYFFIAPKIIGSDSKYDMFSDLNIEKINDAYKLKFEKIKQIGNDLLIAAYPVHDLGKITGEINGSNNWKGIMIKITENNNGDEWPEMFTGIIKEIGKVNKIKDSGENKEIEISSTNLIKTMNVGDSMAVNGCCLTVKKLNINSFLCDISYNTLNFTTFKFLKTGESVNLEDSLSPNSKISGHFVAGHIDCIAKILKITKIGNSYKLDIQTPEQILPYTAPKGSVALDGISLTIAESAKNNFSTAIIPYTFNNTNLKLKEAGDFVNVEVDLMSRYIEQILKYETNKKIGEIKEKDDNLKEKLKKYGFLE